MSQVKPSHSTYGVTSFHVSFLSLDCSQNAFVSDCISYRRQESLPRVDLVLSLLGWRLHVWPSFLLTGFQVPSLSHVLRYCFGICVSVHTYSISTPLQNSTVLRDWNHMDWRDCKHIDCCEHSIVPFVHGLMINLSRAFIIYKYVARISLYWCGGWFLWNNTPCSGFLVSNKR